MLLTLYIILFILAFTVLYLLGRLFSLQGSLRRLRRALAKLEGVRDNHPEDVEEDELGG